MRSARLSLLAVAALAAGACGGDGGTGPGSAQLVAQTPVTAQAIVATTVETPPSVRLVKAGEPVAGATVTFSVTAGGGSAVGLSQVTDANGIATVGAWTLGTTAGTNTLRASTAGTPPVEFTVTGQPGMAQYIVPASGNGQSAPPNAAVSTRPAVRILDDYGNGVPGMVVTFAVQGGGGSVTGATVSTDATGTATVGGWTLGSGEGQNTLRASAAGLPPVLFTATALVSASAFYIDLRFIGTAPSAAVQAAFARAKARWEQVITGDLPDYALTTGNNSIPADGCLPGQPALTNTTIDDIVIFATVDSIDGAGQVLGSASPCYLHGSSNFTTLAGQMRFDRADLANMVANGTIDDVILHEMGHVLGIGTFWGRDFANVLSRSPTTFADTAWIKTTDVRYLGASANGAWGALGGAGGTPVENCASGVASGCGGGTWLAHWREATFRSELMTGYISSSGNPLSRVTIGTLADLGYVVNMSAADAYTLPTNASFSGVVAQATRLNEDLTPRPIFRFEGGARRRVY